MSREDAARHYHVDEGRMIDIVFGIPSQIGETWSLSEDFKLPFPGEGSRLVICGMGGSAISGRLLSDLIGQDLRISIHLEKGYLLPAFAGRETPVICVSYSGNTEEVIGCFRDAISRGCRPAVITSGGKLEEEACKAGVPLLKVPGGIPPRAAIGHLFTPLLRILSSWGIYEIADEEIEAVVHRVGRLAQKYYLDGDQAENTALKMAKKLYGKIPIIYSGNGLLAGMAYRWKCQFNENSKSMAFSNTFPELGHNEVMGWECPERFREDLFLIVLQDCEDHASVQKRMRITYSLLESLSGGAILINSVGGEGRVGRLFRLLSNLILGDFTSVYLAVEYGKDPTPIEKIESIKERLRLENE